MLEESDWRRVDLKMEESKKEQGYDESDFTEDYWLESNKLQGARIDKDASHLIDYLRDLFAVVGGGDILDIGAGAGNVVHQLRVADFEADGKEFSASGRKLAKERFNITLDVLDLREGIVCVGNGYNYSLCFGVLSMIPFQYLPGAIREIARVTAKAVLVCSQTRVDADSNIHHITGLSRLEYYSMFKNAGMTDITSILPPQGRKYGIGIRDEFCGLFARDYLIRKI